MPEGAGQKAVALDRTEGPVDALGHVERAIEGDEAAATGDKVDEAFEGGLDGGKIGVDVGVVELDVGEDGGVGKVVEELGAFVEEGGVVLVAFEQKRLGLGADHKRRPEVLGESTDEERRGELRLRAGGYLVDPGQHACGGGLAVGAGDDEGFAVGQELVVEERGHGGEGDALVEDEFELRVAARDGVTDDDEVGARGEVGLGVGLVDGDVEVGELDRHGWVGGGVGAGDAVSQLLEHAGEGGHGGAADSDEMDVFRLHAGLIVAG